MPRVFISNKYEQGYIFYLFHNKFEPKKYLESGGSQRISQECHPINNVFFGNCSEYLIPGSILISQDRPESNNFIKIEEIKDSKGLVVGGVYRNI